MCVYEILCLKVGRDIMDKHQTYPQETEPFVFHFRFQPQNIFSLTWLEQNNFYKKNVMVN